MLSVYEPVQHRNGGLKIRLTQIINWLDAYGELYEYDYPFIGIKIVDILEHFLSEKGPRHDNVVQFKNVPNFFLLLQFGVVIPHHLFLFDMSRSSAEIGAKGAISEGSARFQTDPL